MHEIGNQEAHEIFQPSRYPPSNIVVLENERLTCSVYFDKCCGNDEAMRGSSKLGVNYQLPFRYQARYLPPSWFKYVMANLLGGAELCRLARL